MKTWNFGIIGAGLIADFHARAIADIPNAKLLACCDIISARAEELSNKHGCRAFKSYEDMLKSGEIDIVTIATPSGFHMEPTVAAAQAGKHVICEKPLDITLERIDTMIAAHEKCGTYLGGIFPYRFNDSQAALSNRSRGKYADFELLWTIGLIISPKNLINLKNTLYNNKN